jgi:YD repeat-containing protein
MYIDDRVTCYYDTTGRLVETMHVHVTPEGDTTSFERELRVENREEKWSEWRTLTTGGMLEERRRSIFNAEGNIVEHLWYAGTEGNLRLNRHTTWSYDAFGRVIRIHTIMGPDREIVEEKEEHYSYDTVPASKSSVFRTSVTSVWQYGRLGSLGKPDKMVDYYDEDSVLRQTWRNDSPYPEFEAIEVDSMGRPTIGITVSAFQGDTTFWRGYNTYDVWGSIVLHVGVKYKSHTNALADIDGVEDSREVRDYEYDPYGNWTYLHWSELDEKPEPPPTNSGERKYFITRQTSGDLRRVFTYFPSAPPPTATIH